MNVHDVVVKMAEEKGFPGSLFRLLPSPILTMKLPFEKRQAIKEIRGIRRGIPKTRKTRTERHFLKESTKALNEAA